jgi:glucosylceramidase
MKTTVILFCYSLFIASSLWAQQVEWVYSVPDSRWQKSTKIKLETLPDNGTSDLRITHEKAQIIDGFGGCFNELGWDALLTLPEAKRTEALRQLFSPQEANFTCNRVPMGASDYALSYYSLNDVDGDFEMANFNIDRDRYILIPYIRAAQKINPRIKLWASPWTPPAWMKTNRHYAGHPDKSNGLAPQYSARAEGNSNGLTTSFVMLKGYLEAYALYFARFIRAYEKEGIAISAVHVQNEPYHIPNFPSCSWRAEDLACFIGHYLGPKLEEEKIGTDIYFGTLNIADPAYVHTAMNDSVAARYIKGVGFQWAGKRAIPVIHEQYPDLKLMQTESECGNGSNDWAAAEHTWDLLNLYLSHGANVYDYWNMALDTSGVSTWGWKQNALLSINRSTGEVIYNPEFFLLKHLSHFVLPGAYRLKTSGGGDHLAFINPDGKIVLVLVNKEDKEKAVKIAVQHQMLSLTLKAKSFNTIRF